MPESGYNTFLGWGGKKIGGRVPNFLRVGKVYWVGWKKLLGGVVANISGRWGCTIFVRSGW